MVHLREPLPQFSAPHGTHYIVFEVDDVRTMQSGSACRCGAPCAERLHISGHGAPYAAARSALCRTPCGGDPSSGTPDAGRPHFSTQYALGRTAPPLDTERLMQSALSRVARHMQRAPCRTAPPLDAERPMQSGSTPRCRAPYAERLHISMQSAFCRAAPPPRAWSALCRTPYAERSALRRLPRQARKRLMSQRLCDRHSCTAAQAQLQLDARIGDAHTAQRP